MSMGTVRRIWAMIAPGTRWLLALWFIGGLLCFTPAAASLPLIGANVRHGELWRIATYAWMPNRMLDWLTNGIALAILGSALEQRWSARTLWAYSGFVVAATGLTWSFVPLAEGTAWQGSAPLLFGLLLAAGRTGADQRIALTATLSVSLAVAALAFGALSAIATIASAGWTSALFALLGAGWGYAYLLVQSRRGEQRAQAATISRRINRLEL